MIHKSLNEAAYWIIREKIINGEFELGSRLREDQLAEEIEISRTPIREAINRLISDGFVVKRSQQGLYLIDPNSEEINNRIDIRISLEKLSVQKCIENASESELSEIFSSLSSFKDALTLEDFDECNRLDAEFHSTIARIARNIRLISMLNELAAFFTLIRRAEKLYQPKEKNVCTLIEHTAIAEAVMQRDVVEAKRAIVTNIETMRTNLHSMVPVPQTVE